MKDFFKSKLNIALFSIQVIAIVFLLFGEMSSVCFMFFLVLESVFFVMYGIRYLLLNRKIETDQKMYELLPVNKDDREKNSKKINKNKKSNTVLGVVFIIFGIVLITLIF